jgi:hypothetical protein
MRGDSPISARFFDVYTNEQLSRPSPLEQLASIISETGVQASTTSGRGIAQATLPEQLHEADVIHFHGHVAGSALEKYLILDMDDIMLEATGTAAGAGGPN